MSLQMIFAVVLMISGHVTLHFRSEYRYRVGAAWMMLGAFCLASGFASELKSLNGILESKMTRIKSAEPADRMAKQKAEPTWTFRTIEGHELDVFKPISNEGRIAWPAKLNF